MRRNILDITEEIINLLKKNKELSIRRISIEIKSHRTVVLKSLEFLKKINYVLERKSKGNIPTRLFSLK